MARYESARYKEIGFFVGGAYRQFRGGVFSTDVPAEIAILDAMTDATRVIDEVQPEEAVAIAPKTPAAPRKGASAQTSGK
ncbi:hypothetical protein [Paenibacillus agricola]|uniref:hypothetical protein n=1 Tax=Paenibacillus agricola TaxID=2716264 RepID=UPI001A9DB4C7|nr:hypothetical protein [Paenibacillus agricola]